jgi:hypothetical protein
MPVVETFRGKTFNYDKEQGTDKRKRDPSEPPKGVIVAHFCAARNGEKIMMYLDDIKPEWKKNEDGNWCADIDCPHCPKVETYTEKVNNEEESKFQKAA